jgi:3'(2'), 5'-bisphosphate nucleotidase
MTLSARATRITAIACEAGAILLRHYAQGTEARMKRDASPVTAADEEAEALILQRLAQEFPGIPVIAEEAIAAGATAIAGPRFFLVDPLDGTREFLARNGEFTVNIALIELGMPVCGVVLAPALSRAFAGDRDGGAWELSCAGRSPSFESARRISVRKAPPEGLTAIVSRSHHSSETEGFLAGFRIAGTVEAGSSLKFCLIAAGEADLYPRFGRTMEWDTAAGHAVLAAAGGSVTKIDGTPFLYGKTDENFANPFFIARGD